MFDDLKPNQNQEKDFSEKIVEEKKEAKHHHSFAEAFEHRLEELKGIGIQRAKRKRIFLILLGVFGAIMVVSVSTLVYTTWPDAKTFVLRIYNNKFKKDSGVMCAMDVKVCPDGSYVSRVAPDCEFAECPETDQTEEKKLCAGEGEHISTMPSPDGEKRLKCCEGLRFENNYKSPDGSCASVLDYGVCINCGDGECGTGEDECSCPDDCETLGSAENWKKFISEEYGFRFEYPENWFLLSEFGIGKTLILGNYNYEIGTEDEEYGEKIYLGKIKIDFTLSEYNESKYKEEISCASNQEIENLECNDEEINGIIYKRMLLNHKYFGEDEHISLVTARDNYIFAVSAFYSNDELEEENIEMIEKIFSTFNFFSGENDESSGTVEDSDDDGLNNDQEAEYGTDPNNPDTDGDGYLDGEEVENGYNPNGEGKLEIFIL